MPEFINTEAAETINRAIAANGPLVLTTYARQFWVMEVKAAGNNELAFRASRSRRFTWLTGPQAINLLAKAESTLGSVR